MNKTEKSLTIKDVVMSCIETCDSCTWTRAGGKEKEKTGHRTREDGRQLAKLTKDGIQDTEKCPTQKTRQLKNEQKMSIGTSRREHRNGQRADVFNLMNNREVHVKATMSYHYIWTTMNNRYRYGVTGSFPRPGGGKGLNVE